MSKSISTCVAVFFLALSLSGCGRKGALEPPPGVSTERTPPKTNTFFSPSAQLEPEPKGDLDPGNLPLNPQLGSTGVVTVVSKQNQASKTSKEGILPVGGGRKAKPIPPPKDSFILDPLL